MNFLKHPKVDLMVILGCFFTLGQLFAQENPPDIDARRFFEMGDSLSVAKSYKASNEFYIKAFKGFELRKDWSACYESFKRIKRNYRAIGDSRALIVLIRELNKSIPDSAIVLKGRLGFYEASSLNHIGSNLEAIKIYKKVLPQFLESNQQNFLISTYRNLCLSYSRLTDYQSAIDIALEGISFIEKTGDKKRQWEYVNIIGRAYFYDGQTDKAKEMYFKALGLGSSNYYTYLNLAEVYAEEDNYSEAENYLDLADKEREFHDREYYTRRAQLFQEKEMIDSAIIYQSQAVKLLSSSWDKRNYVKERVQLARLQFEVDSMELAVINAHRAITTMFPKVDSSDVFYRPNPKELKPEIWIIEAIYLKARYYSAMYQKTSDNKYFEELGFYTEMMYQLLDELRTSQNTIDAQYQLGEYGQKMYAHMIEFYVNRFYESKKKEHFERAFLLSQRANSFVLKNAISERQALQYAEVDRDSLFEYLSLGLEIAQANEDVRVDRLNRIIEYDVYKFSLHKNYPQLQHYAQEETIDLDDLRKCIDQKTLVLKFFFFENKLTVFVIGRHHHLIRTIVLPDSFDVLIEDYTTGLSELSDGDDIKERENTFTSSSRALYQIILKDILQTYSFQNINHLVIVPDGPIEQISFAALLLYESNNWYDMENFLISRFAISYLHYCGQLIPSKDRIRRNEKSFVGFGISYQDISLNNIASVFPSNRANYSSENKHIQPISFLKYAREEVLNLSQLMNGEAFIDEEVTSITIEEGLESKSIVHFAAHAILDQNFMNSALLLNDKTDSINLFTYRDILNTLTSTDLVTLGACRTTGGRIISGEGLMGLARAFCQSGSQSVMGSSWNVPDRASMLIMNEFYTELSHGSDKAQALRNAQVNYFNENIQRSPIIRTPHNWAAWVIYGDYKPVFNGRVFYQQAWFQALIFFSLLFLLLYRKYYL